MTLNAIRGWLRPLVRARQRGRALAAANWQCDLAWRRAGAYKERAERAESERDELRDQLNRWLRASLDETAAGE